MRLARPRNLCAFYLLAAQRFAAKAAHSRALSRTKSARALAYERLAEGLDQKSLKAQRLARLV